MDLKQNEIVIAISVLVVIIAAFLVLRPFESSIYNMLLLGGGVSFDDGISQELGPFSYLNWNHRSVMIFVGRGGIPDGNFKKEPYVQPLQTAFLTSLANNDVGAGSVCQVRLTDAGIETGSGFSGIPSSELPVPTDKWLNGKLVETGTEGIIRLETSGGQPLYGYNTYNCVLDEPYPQLDADIYTFKLRLISNFAQVPSDEIVLCGNGVCDNEESFTTCPQDCATPADEDEPTTPPSEEQPAANNLGLLAAVFFVLVVAIAGLRLFISSQK